MLHVILNHKTLKFRVIVDGLTVARVDEIERTPWGSHRGWSWNPETARYELTGEWR